MSLPCSYPEALRALDVGESFAITRRLDQDGTSANDLRRTTDSMRNTLTAAVGRVRESMPKRFKLRIDCGSYRTSEFAIVIVANVTRLA